MIVIDDLVPSTPASNTFEMTYNSLAAGYLSSTSLGAQSSTAAFMTLGTTPASATVARLSGSLEIDNVSASAVRPIWGQLSVYTVVSTTNTLTPIQFSGINTTAAAITSVTFKMASGNLASGTIKIYGRV